MKKYLIVILCSLLLLLVGCQPSSVIPTGSSGKVEESQSTTEVTQPDSNSATTEASTTPTNASTAPLVTTAPTEVSPAPTGPEIINTRFLVNYDAQFPDTIYTDNGVDVTKCESGNLYSCDRETGEIIWLYKADEIALYVEDSQRIDHQWFCSDYIYYVKKDDRSKVFRMNYLGTVKDELVHEFSSVGSLLMTSMEFGHDMVAVQTGYKFIIFDVLENQVIVEREDPNMDSLCDFIYDWEKVQLVVVYNTFYPDAPDGAKDGREYYNVTTGELADTYIW